MPKLTDLKAKSAKPKEKQYKLYDESGLHLLVKLNGTKLWRWRYFFEGKEKAYSIRIYPEISLSSAGSVRDSLRLTLSTGIDPMGAKKQKIIEGILFETLANDWFAFKSTNWRESYKRTQAGRLHKHVMPIFGGEEIIKISRADILKKIKSLKINCTYDTANRILNMLSDIFNYSAKMGIIELNPCFGLEALLIPVQSKSRGEGYTGNN